ncbi:MAG: tRNA (N(6)-L-threonylcarbamoyladenosine(37)-C(2))-methylthiotransferase MtaB [Candidatus Aquicultorales bacterium]
MSAYSFALHTLGCKVNQYEGDKVSEGLAGLGMLRVGFDEVADVYVVNGCTVTGTANHKARQLIRRASKRNPLALIVVTGCYADDARDEIENLLNGGLIVDNALKGLIVEKVAARFGLSDTPVVGVPAARSHARPVVKVQDGCDCFCAYCIVPHVRSELRSKPLNEVIEEVDSLNAAEVVLTGIHLGHYGIDLKPRVKLEDLVGGLTEETGPRIRLSSLEMNELTDGLVESAKTGRLAPHFHLPLQSGSDKILQAMNRRYTAGEFIETCAELKKALPDVALTTDVIVGFPGETDDDFERTLDAVREAGFGKVHIFRFSQRRGTPAASMSGQVEPKAKEDRLRRLTTVAEELAGEYAGRQVGKVLSVVAESASDGLWTGTSENYLRVGFEGPEGICGRAVEVEALEVQENGVYGRLIGS